MALEERSLGITVSQVLEDRVREHPDRVFLIYGDRRMTFAQINDRANALAAALHELGIGAGDRIALSLPNWPEFVVSMFAAAKLGAVVVPLNPNYTVPELQYMIRHSEAAVVVTVELADGASWLGPAIYLASGVLASVLAAAAGLALGESLRRRRRPAAGRAPASVDESAP